MSKALLQQALDALVKAAFWVDDDAIRAEMTSAAASLRVLLEKPQTEEVEGHPV